MNVFNWGMRLGVDLNWIVLSMGRTLDKSEPGMKSCVWVLVRHCCWWNKGIGGISASVREKGGEGERIYTEAPVHAETTTSGTFSSSLSRMKASKTSLGLAEVKEKEKTNTQLIIDIGICSVSGGGEVESSLYRFTFLLMSDLCIRCILDKHCWVFFVPHRQNVTERFAF